MTKFSSFKEQQLLAESWRTFLVEEQPVGQAQPQLDIRNPIDVKNMIIAKARGKTGSAGPDQITKQNIQKNNKILAATRSVSQPIQAAQILLQLFNQLSPEDQAEAAKAAQIILQTKPQQQATPPVQKEVLIKENTNLTLSALQALGGGSLEKGMQRLGTGAFIGAIAIGLAQIASGNLQGAASTGVKTLVNSIQKLYSSNNIGDLASILSSAIDATTDAMTGKRDIPEAIEFHGAHLDDGTLVCEACLQEVIELSNGILLEAKYQGRTVTLNKPTKGDVKKFKVYVKDPKTGNVKKVNFGDPNMKIKKNIPARRKSFRARHHCENPGPKTKARYWSCKKW